MHIAVSPHKVRVITIAIGVLIIAALLLFLSVQYNDVLLKELNPVARKVVMLVLLIAAIVSFAYAVYTKGTDILSKNEIAESHSRYIWLYQNSPVPYVTIDAHGKITQVNRAALRLFQLLEEGLLSKKLSSFFESDDENDLSVTLGKLKTNVVIDGVEVQIVISEKISKWVLLSVFSYGTTNERLVSLIDITKQKQIDTAKSEFVSLASHQLRTPIAAIKWNLELLGADYTGELNEKQGQYYQKVSRNVEKMRLLIDDFLSVSKLETGTFATEPTDIPLASFCNDILDEFQERIQKKQLHVQRDYAEDAHMLHTDIRLLHIIVSNLVSNAVKYTPEDGSLKLGYEGIVGATKIIIEDTGFGIPEEEIDKLFSKFFRASNAQESISEGTGLGLYIVKQSVEILGGQISVESIENEGTRFVITLPV